VALSVLAHCPKCDAALPVAAEDAPATIKCGRCGREIALAWSDAVRRDTAVDRCPVCGGADFYSRKDFDPKVGVTVVVIGALISAAFYWYGRDLIAYGILAAAVLVDLVVYGRLKDVTVCYRCHSEFRGSYRRTAPAFDLHMADVLEVEYERRIGRR
jgi:DNA-directed RNA polymerase subunit RPC12/RpoP